MTIIRALIQHEAFTQLPEHVCTNTMFFNAVGPLNDAVANDLTVLLTAFYDTFDGIYSPVLTGDIEVKYYDMADPKPRQPWNPPYGFTVAGGDGNTGMPEEVALAVSFHASAPFTPRRRGRIYLGPVASGSFLLGGNGEWCRFQPATLTIIAGACVDLIADSGAGGVPWCVYSAMDNVARTVVGGWIDNSPDTQRRRGHDETARSTFGV